MLFHYLKLAFRLLKRNPRFSLINILGLATGFAAFLILWPYAQAELNTDTFHKDYDQIARLGTRVQLTVDEKNWTEFSTVNSFCGAATIIMNRFGEVTELTRLVPQKNFSKRVQGSDPKVLISLRKENDQQAFFSEKTVAYADANFFRFFSFPLALGSPNQILAQPGTVALSETVAKKYFASANPMGKVIYLSDSLPFRVSGVFKDLPKNTHFQFDVLLSTAGIPGIDVFGWDWTGYSYVKLKDGDFTALETKLRARSDDLFGPPQDAHTRVSILVEPLPQLAFTNKFDNAFEVKSRQPLVLLNVIAFVVLGLAWINYVSLSIHQLRKRLAEIGTRKAVGASSNHFALQFLIESALMNGIAFLLALTLVQLTGTGMERWFGIYLVSWADVPAATVTVIGLVLLGGMLVTGLYPVWIAGEYKPLQLLRKLKTHRSPRWVNGVVTLQYTCAIVLLIWITAVYAQINFIMNKDLGIDKQAIVVVDSPIRRSPAFESQLRTFLHRVSTLRGVRDVTFSVTVPGDDVHSLTIRKNSTAIVVPLDNSGGVDEHFIPLYNIQLLAGRNFGSDQPADQKAVLLSEAAVKRMGYRSVQEALGSTVFRPGNGNDNVAVEVIGVYRDYEFRPLLNGMREDGRGSILTYKRSLAASMRPDKISVKINAKEYQATIEGLKNTFTATFGDSFFEWRFLEEHLEKQYVGEQRARNQIALFTVIAIFIACLGLLGMITNKAARKTKEIGIRKILGAKPHHIAQLLLKATLLQAGVATLVGIPLAEYLVSRYLETFSERVSLPWWHDGFAPLVLLLVMFGTILSVLRKAVNGNPAEALRYE